MKEKETQRQETQSQGEKNTYFRCMNDVLFRICLASMFMRGTLEDQKRVSEPLELGPVVSSLVGDGNQTLVLCATTIALNYSLSLISSPIRKISKIKTNRQTHSDARPSS